MDLVVDIAQWSVAAIGVLLALGQIVAREVGVWLGLRHAQREGYREGVGIVVGALLGLLAFVLALTLSFANARFTERRAGALAEANAIGTAWLRAEAVGHPRGDAIARLLEDYARQRADFVRAETPEAAAATTRRNNDMQTLIWGHVAALVREKPDPISSAVMAAVNDAFDMATAERFAYAFPLPARLFWMLTGMAVLSMLALGYQLGLRRTPLRLLSFLLIAVWTVVIVQILDLASARIGALRTSTAAYEWTIQGFQGGVRIPPLPAPR